MQRYEYRVIPAPRRGEKARGVKTTEDRFALALGNVMNAMGAEGWDYVRADALPCDERAGLTGGTRTTFLNMLVFRRVIDNAVAQPTVALPEAPAVLPQIETVEPEVAPPPLRLGAADAPEGSPRAIGPARPDVAAE